MLCLLILFLFFNHLPSIGQSDSSNAAYQNLDTLKYYNVSLASGPGKDCAHFDFSKIKIKYYVDCKEVSKEVYDKFFNENNRLGDCTPCYLEQLDKNGNSVSLGIQYTDCIVGEWKEFYPDGKVKLIGHYRENKTGNWDDIWKRGYCSVKEGVWIYYDENGSVLKTENYFNNKLVE